MKDDSEQDHIFPEAEAEEEKQAEQERYLSEKYRHVFIGQPLGREVLGNVLATLHFGDQLYGDDEFSIEQKAESYNCAIGILAKCGLFQKEIIECVVNNIPGVTPHGRSTA